VVTGGEGPPLLLVHGWPQSWYAWRLVMPGLARDFSVVAVDQRGCGLSGKPAPGGYDTATLASDLVALMDALGTSDSPWSATTPACGRLRPGRGSPGPGGSPGRGRGGDAGRVPLTAVVRQRARPTTGCGTSRSTGSPPRSTNESSPDAKTSTPPRSGNQACGT
jgi:hypothetical protein